MTRLLNTPIIGRLVASVDSSSIDMLAGLSKLPILRIPPCFAPMPSPWAATARSLSRAREDLASFRPPPVRNAGGKDPHCRCAGPFWALVQAATSERLSPIGLRGTGARYRRSIALLLARLAGKRLLADLVAHRVDVIVTTGGTPPALAAKSATSTIPIVFINAGDPVGIGLVASLARPGGNITGFTNITTELMPKLVAPAGLAQTFEHVSVVFRSMPRYAPTNKCVERDRRDCDKRTSAGSRVGRSELT
jgi:hypothetical protein